MQVKGIGRWTVQMFLMFRLGRPDVLPELDLGVQNAIQRAYGLKKRPTPKDVLRIGEPWRPYASMASWYLWRSLENGDGAGVRTVAGVAPFASGSVLSLRQSARSSQRTARRDELSPQRHAPPRHRRDGDDRRDDAVPHRRILPQPGGPAPKYTLQAETNRLREMPLPAPRGVIYDRNDKVIADNVIGYSVSVLAPKEDSLRACCSGSPATINMTPSQMEQAIGASGARRAGRRWSSPTRRSTW